MENFIFVQMFWKKTKGFVPIGEEQGFFHKWEMFNSSEVFPRAVGTPLGSGKMSVCTQKYYIQWYHDLCTHMWIKFHPHLLQI